MDLKLKGKTAIVTGASEKGTWARLLSIPVEGKLVRGFKGADVGDRIGVRLIDVDVERGYIDLGQVGPSGHGCHTAITPHRQVKRIDQGESGDKASGCVD